VVVLGYLLYVDTFSCMATILDQFSTHTGNPANGERQRGTRVITLIHRQETIRFLGIPLRNYISVEDSEQLLRAIRLTPDSMPIDLILHTPGGLVLASEQIARALNIIQLKSRYSFHTMRCLVVP
jgi:ClpP class serine protease